MESILSSRRFLLRPVRFPLETFASIRFGLCLEGAGRRGWNAAIRSGLSHNQTITRVRPTSDSAISTTRLFTRRNLLRHIIGVGSGASMITTPGCFSRNPTNTVYPGDPTQLGLRATSKALRSRAQSPVELTKRCLERITRLDPQLNSFITVTGGGGSLSLPSEMPIVPAREVACLVQWVTCYGLLRSAIRPSCAS